MKRRSVKINQALQDLLGDNEDLTIYRFISFEYLLQLLNSQQLWMSQTILWEDVHENFITKSKMSFGGSLVTNTGFLPYFYGQCWTLNKETDAMWRIYSPNRLGVRLKSTIKKLSEISLEEIDYQEFSTRQIVIGKVSYLNSDEINDYIVNSSKSIINDYKLMESLFIKKEEFIHENEVRIILHKNANDEDAYQGVPKFLKLEVNPNDFLTEITFDPRMREEIFAACKKAVQGMGFTNEINKSGLYNYEPYNISFGS